ncbi:MAG: nucleotidyl transferase AbiEii/AbiGii toxin family protein [Microgenomates group bacterium]
MKNILENMFKDILTNNQKKLLPLIKLFSSNFYLVGGTAVALQIGHRRSIDFDLFTDNSFNPLNIRKIILKKHQINQTLVQGEGELTTIVNQVKITFFHYPFSIKRKLSFEDIIKLPDLLTLGAMKAFALGRRSKWKDYVDLYFIFQRYSLKQLTEKAKEIFKSEFNEKLFRAQLSYFDDIDYSEEIEFMRGFEKNKNEIKSFLEKIALSD